MNYRPKSQLPQSSNIKRNNSRGLHSNIALRMQPSNSNRSSLNMALQARRLSTVRIAMDDLQALPQLAYMMSTTLMVLYSRLRNNSYRNGRASNKPRVLPTKRKVAINRPMIYRWKSSNRDEDNLVCKHSQVPATCNPRSLHLRREHLQCHRPLHPRPQAYVHRHLAHQRRMLLRPGDQEQQVVVQVCHRPSRVILVGPLV
jgi:hypothetical protein